MNLSTSLSRQIYKYISCVCVRALSRVGPTPDPPLATPCRARLRHHIKIILREWLRFLETNVGSGNVLVFTNKRDLSRGLTLKESARVASYCSRFSSMSIMK